MTCDVKKKKFECGTPCDNFLAPPLPMVDADEAHTLVSSGHGYLDVRWALPSSLAQHVSFLLWPMGCLMDGLDVWNVQDVGGLRQGARRRRSQRSLLRLRCSGSVANSTDIFLLSKCLPDDFTSLFLFCYANLGREKNPHFEEEVAALFGKEDHLIVVTYCDSHLMVLLYSHQHMNPLAATTD